MYIAENRPSETGSLVMQPIIVGKSKYGGMTISDVKSLKAIEDEIRRLKQVVADLTQPITAVETVREDIKSYNNM